MTSFNSSIKNIMSKLEQSNYPLSPFIYTDEFVEELLLRTPPAGLVELAIHNQNYHKVLSTKLIVSLEEIICIELVIIQDDYTNQGYMTMLLNELKRHFPQHYLCITNVHNERFAKWITMREGWKGSSYLHPMWNTSAEKAFNKRLMEQNFVLLPVQTPDNK